MLTMELSKKVGYVRGLMAGLKVDDSTNEGKVLLAMADLLEEMSDEIEMLDEAMSDVYGVMGKLEELVGDDDFDDEDFEDDEDFDDDEDEEMDVLDEIEAAMDDDNDEVEFGGISVRSRFNGKKPPRS